MWGVRYDGAVCVEADQAVRCCIAAQLTRLLHRWLLCVRALCTASRQAWAEGRHGSSLADRPSTLDREVGEGGAQRLLARIGHVGEAVEEQGGESGEASQLEQPLVRDVVTVR